MGVLVIICLVVLGLHLSGLVAVALVRRRRFGHAITPRVAILKPLKGMDEGIRENLETFFALDYPGYELLFGVADADDPVIPLVREMMASHPDVPARLVVGEQDGSILNPKVRSLSRLLDQVSCEFVVISDSNIRVRPDYLRTAMSGFGDPRVAVVTNIIAGVGEGGLGAMLEHEHLDGYIAMAQAWCSTYGRLTSVIGKSMALRLSALREIGGIAPLGDYLAEDYLMGRRLAARGFRVVLHGSTVENHNVHTPLHAFLDRHYRWLVMRWRINPLTCLLEIATVPTLWIAVLAWTDPLLSLCFLAAFTLVEQATCLLVRGHPLPSLSLLAKPLKDALHVLLLGASLLNDRVNWRGHVLKLGWSTRITVLSPEERAGLPPFLFPMRMGDEWPPARAPWRPRIAR